MDLLDDYTLINIFEYTCTDYKDKSSWIETCKLQLVCKRWKNIIDYLRNSSDFICNDVRKKICNGILEWYNIYELKGFDCSGERGYIYMMQI